MGLVGLVGIGFLGAEVVGLQLLAEQLEGILIVRQQILAGHLGGIVGDGRFVATADRIGLDGGLHGLVAHLFGGRGLQLRVKQVDQLVDAGLGAGAGLRGDQIVAVIGGGAHRLGAILGQTHDLGGIQGVGAGVDRIQIHIVVEQHVLHGQGVTVGELDAVFQHEGVGDGAIVILHDVVVLHDHGLVVTIGHLDLTVHILGGQHTDLGHGHDGAIRRRGGKERVEQTVQLIGHNDKSIGTAAAAREDGRHAHAQRQTQQERENFGFHNIAPFLFLPQGFINEQIPK